MTTHGALTGKIKLIDLLFPVVAHCWFSRSVANIWNKSNKKKKQHTCNKTYLHNHIKPISQT